MYRKIMNTNNKVNIESEHLINDSKYMLLTRTLFEEREKEKVLILFAFTLYFLPSNVQFFH